MEKLAKVFEDFENFITFYSGYCTIIFLIGFTLGALHQYYGL